MPTRWHISLFAALATIAICGTPRASASSAPPERTLTVDPVELVAGREVPGKAELAVEREGIAYWFATDQNRAAFEKEPAKFEVADGGACGRMGPLSGLGDARRHAAHAGRIYFFASDGCREAFLKEPALYVETADTMPFGSHEQVLAGRATLDKVVAWAGGAEKLKAIKTYRATAARTETQGDKVWKVTDETVVAFPRRYFQKQAWNDSWYSTASGPAGGSMAKSNGEERIADSRRRAFERTMARWPIVLLKARVDESAGADCPGLVVVGDGEGELAGTPVEYVKVWLNGATSRLTVEKATGKLLQLAFHGRDTTARVGDSVRTYTAYATVDGVTLPTAYTVTFNGKDIPAAGAKVDAFELDAALTAGLFGVAERAEAPVEAPIEAR